MKKTLVLLLLAMFVSTTLAVVDSPNKNGSEISITSSSATSSAAVDSNGTEWSSSIKMSGTDSNVTQGDRVENTSFQENKTSFTGFIQAPNPCHVIDQETEKTDDQKYRINIVTKVDNPEQVCTQQIVMIKYNGSLEAPTPYTLEIQHNNQSIDTFTHPDNQTNESNPKNQEKNTFTSFVDWLKNLF